MSIVTNMNGNVPLRASPVNPRRASPPSLAKSNSCWITPVSHNRVSVDSVRATTIPTMHTPVARPAQSPPRARQATSYIPMHASSPQSQASLGCQKVPLMAGNVRAKYPTLAAARGSQSERYLVGSPSLQADNRHVVQASVAIVPQEVELNNRAPCSSSVPGHELKQETIATQDVSSGYGHNCEQRRAASRERWNHPQRLKEESHSPQRMLSPRSCNTTAEPKQGNVQCARAGDVTPPELEDQNKKQREERQLNKGTPALAFDGMEQKSNNMDGIAQHAVFSWLNWAPEPDSACYRTLHANFPGALPGKALFYRSTTILEERFKFCRENTLFGVSICPDEINNQKGTLADLMKDHWGECFPLGGIGGAPFVGATGFNAFSHHVPDDGNVLVLFGPHVAITATGEVGKYRRDGQHHHSTACGAVIGAYNACISGKSLTDGPGQGTNTFNYNEIDMQMDWLKHQIQPHAKRIVSQSCPLAALAFQAYEIVKTKLLKIVNTDFGCGKLALLGGIQINMPAPYEDHFLPLMFDIHRIAEPVQNVLGCFAHENILEDLPLMVVPALESDDKLDDQFDDGFGQVGDGFVRQVSNSSSVFEGGETTKPAKLDRRAEQIEDAKQFRNYHLYAWLNWGPQPNTPCYKMLHEYFPGAIPGPALHARLTNFLSKELGFRPHNTLFGMSICPDEINNRKGSLTNRMADHWGEFFPLGGISGAPFVGKTGFGAFSHHVPDDGNIVLLFGPHVAISKEGEVGKYLREGQHHNSTACGAVIGAYNAVAAAHDGGADVEFDEADMQMGWIKSQIAPHVDRIKRQQNPMAELAYQAYEMVEAKIKKIVNTNFGSGYLVLVGGIQLNMPEPCSDHFLPLFFEVRSNSEKPKDLMKVFKLNVPDEEWQIAHEAYEKSVW